MFFQLLRDRERNTETEDPTPLTEEEREISIHSSLKTSSMNYILPPLNDSASSADKKAESILYGILLALVQATRPIDYYAHLRIQESGGINTAYDSEVTSASTMRDLLAEIAENATQARLDNPHKGLNLSGKPNQLFESDNKPLTGQEAFDVLISKKSVVKRQRVQPFCMRRLNTIPKDTNSSKTSTAQGTTAATTAEANSSNRTADRRPPVKFSLKGVSIETQNSPPRPQTSFGPPQAHPTRGEQNFKMENLASICRTIRRKDYLTILELQDAFMHILVYKNCRKYLRFDWDGRCFQFRVLPFGLSLSPLVFTKILRPVLEWARAKRIRVTAYLEDLLIMRETKEEYAEITRSIYTKLSELGFKVNDEKSATSPSQSITYLGKGSSKRGKQATESFEYDVEMSSELYLEIPVNFDCTAAISPYASQTARTKESITVDSEIMKIESYPYETYHSEPIILKE
ncbi:Pol polyprotein [Smittium culicis]|uniref:Pol polyprotein n=1 Tax=Smittium culicis TaxID=133412 RepID=A0A1R1YHU0_9FUNG|nr:Pol polyprotein [Smittium culicis]